MNEREPSILSIFEILSAYQKSSALKAAIDLKLFTAIGGGATSIDALARQCRASERGIRILCDYMAVLGFLSKQGSEYSLTSTAKLFLDENSPSYAGSIANLLCSPLFLDCFRDTAIAVRNGTTTLPGGGTLAREHPIWVEFARSVGPVVRIEAEVIAKFLKADERPRWKVLDIAAGHGQFGIELARRNPNAEIVALDWANVLAVAEENARAAGVSDRFRTLAGSALTTDYGSGYDLVLLTSFLHHFDPEACGTILGKVYRALKPGGRVVTVEFVPNEDRISPPRAAAFSYAMLVTTPKGDAYTLPELDEMFRKAGFARNELHELIPNYQRLLISHRSEG